MSSRFLLSALVLASGLCLCPAAAAPVGAQEPAGPQSALPADPARLVERFVDAFNRRDLEAISALAADSVEWLSVSEAKISTETAGREALLTSLKSYFASCPSCKSTVKILGVTGPFISALERATWTKGSEAKAQESLSVYEVRDGRILRVWYFPAVKP